MSIDGLGLKDIKVRFSAGEMFDVFAVQGDTLTRGFRATLIDPKTLKPLTPSESFTLQLIAERPENPDQYIVTDGVIEGDQYVVYLSTNMLISPGPLNLQLVLKSDEAVIRSAPWTINIPRALDMDGLRVQGKDILVDYTELRAQMTSFEERAAHITEETDIKLTAYQQAAANMSDMLGLMMGVYPSSEELEDGSKILYWHNKPTREESDLIWMFNGLVLAVSNDGGQTWTGQTSDGTVIARIVYTLQLFAQQIILTDGTTAQEAFDAAGVRYLFNLLGFY